jgi:miniconductance mechanosensitive channel
MTDLINSLLNPALKSAGISETVASHLDEVTAFVVFLIVMFIVVKLVNAILLPIIHGIVKRSKTTWDDDMMNAGLFKWACRLASSIAALVFLPIFIPANDSLHTVLRRIIAALIAALAARTIAAFLEGLHLLYKNHVESAKRKPIKSYIQLLEVFVYGVGIILVITNLANVPAAGIIGGLGAASAVLMLVFKDSILGFVASLQLSSNDMVRIGDWISMPAFNADGSVIDITLQSVMVQNWDNTVSTIPIYQLIAGSFQNWRGMSESGGRRIQRSIYLDQRSVRFLKSEEVDKFCKMPLLKDYMDAKIKEIGEYNKNNNIPEGDYVSGRYLTNLGTYRAYTAAYLKALPIAHKTMTNMVRYLQPSASGIQMEIYLFSADTVWEHYEGIQADILDHLLAILPEFGLHVFQNPSGSDMELIAKKIGERKE